MHNIHNRDLDLNLIPIFDALLREGSVTKAADQLGLSQSAMSHALRRLREFFNDPLFVKTRSGMKPTPRAESLKDSVLELMGKIRQDLLVSTHFDAAKAERVFSFGLTDMGELVFLPPLIEALRLRAPRCRIRSVQVSPVDLPDALESGYVDLALGGIRSVPEGIFQQQLFTHPFVTIVSWRNKDITDFIPLDAFYELEHVAVSLADSPDSYYDSVIDDFGRARKIYLTTPHFLTVPVIIDSNPVLIATVPRELGTVFSTYRAVKVLPTPVDLPRVSLKQYWHPRFHHDEANLWLRTLVRETFEDYPV